MLIQQSDAGFGGLRGRRAGVVRGGLSVILTAVLLAGGASGDWAHGRDDHPLDKFQTGQITGKSDRSVRINGREYALHSKVVIEDDEGRPKQLQDIKADMDVRYLVKEDRVRQLILVTPK